MTYQSALLIVAVLIVGAAPCYACGPTDAAVPLVTCEGCL